MILLSTFYKNKQGLSSHMNSALDMLNEIEMSLIYPSYLLYIT